MGQSLNLYVAEASGRKLSELYTRRLAGGLEDDLLPALARARRRTRSRPIDVNRRGIPAALDAGPLAPPPTSPSSATSPPPAARPPRPLRVAPTAGRAQRRPRTGTSSCARRASSDRRRTGADQTAATDGRTACRPPSRRLRPVDGEERTSMVATNRRATATLSFDLDRPKQPAAANGPMPRRSG